MACEAEEAALQAAQQAEMVALADMGKKLLAKQKAEAAYQAAVTVAIAAGAETELRQLILDACRAKHGDEEPPAASRRK